MPEGASRIPDPPSAFFREHESELVASADIGPVLDLACGRGRHAVAAAALGLRVIAVDRNREALDLLRAFTPGKPGQIEPLQTDLESQPFPPFPSSRFGAVLVFRYLHRPLSTWIEDLIAEGGLLLYETFTRDQRELGWGPSRDEFLLAPGELPTLFPNLEVETYEEGPSKDDRAPRTARLAARRIR